MPRKVGIFYLTYDGCYNYTSGIGTQTRTFLEGIAADASPITDTWEEFEVNLIVPEHDRESYGYSEGHLDYVRGLVERLGGRIFTCSSEPDSVNSNFWTVPNWRIMCESSAKTILAAAGRYDLTFVMTVDSPFLLVPKYLERMRGKDQDIRSVITMYTSTYIHDLNPLPDRLSWELEGMNSIRESDRIKLAHVCDFMTDHFKRFFGVNDDAFVPYQSSLNLGKFLETTWSSEQRVELLNSYAIPDNRDIIFAFGRDSWVKGFDVLIKGCAAMKCDAHLVLLASEFVEDRRDEYIRMIREMKVSCTLLSDFDRVLPSVLSQYDRCRIVVCPSRREPFSNIPLEVALWARDSGPIVLASSADGFVEQISNGVNGFLFRVGDPIDLARRADEILGLSEARRKLIRNNAFSKVLEERDFHENFRKLVCAVDRM